MTLSSVRPTNLPDASVYAPINGCCFIPGCAFERMHSINHIAGGYVIRNYLSDNSRYIRAVVYPSISDSRAIAGALISRQTNELIHVETAPGWRGQGIAKSLLAIYEATHRRKLWTAYVPENAARLLDRYKR